MNTALKIGTALVFLIGFLVNRTAMGQASADDFIVTQPPTVAYAAPATYPSAELERGTSGSVLMLLEIDINGVVVNSSIVESSGEAFSQPALLAIRGFRFTPALNASDTPVPTQIQYRFLFEPSEAPPVRLAGTVQEAGVRTPVTSATIRARNDAGNEVYGTTNDEGSYQLAGLANGVWNVQISAPSLVPEIIEVTISDNNISELNTLSLIHI